MRSGSSTRHERCHLGIDHRCAAPRRHSLPPFAGERCASPSAHDVGLALRDVRLEPVFLVCLLLVPLYLSAGVQPRPGSTVGGDLAIQFFNAFGEELLFRGVIFALLLRLPVWQSIVLNGVLFGAMHLLHGFMGAPWQDALRQAGLTTLGGMMFHAVRLRSGSLWPAIALHMAKNLAVMYSAASAHLDALFEGITVLVELGVAFFVIARPGLDAPDVAPRAAR